jgi:hypothetical protein
MLIMNIEGVVRVLWNTTVEHSSRVCRLRRLVRKESTVESKDEMR